MSDTEFRILIEQGAVAGIRAALAHDPQLANRTIYWHLNQDNTSEPLHYISDCVGNGWLTNGNEGALAELLLAYGAKLNGSEGMESPLLASVSLGAEQVSRVLIDAGADLEATSLFGARALHWAAWMGASTTVGLLIAQGATIEARDTEFGATPLFWAAHGYGPHGPVKKNAQVEAAQLLLAAGANMAVTNKQGVSVIELARACARQDLYKLLQQHV